MQRSKRSLVKVKWQT